MHDGVSCELRQLLGNVTWCTWDEGFYGDVDLSGCIAQLAVHAPGPYFDDGNWRVALYGQASATPRQRESLEAIFLGQAGGGDWRTMMSEIVGVRWVPIEAWSAKGESASCELRAYWI